jgi:hypothetical protein
MATFDIHVYSGVNDILFGASPSDVATKFGPPKRMRTTPLGELEETRGSFFCRYAQWRLVEVSFGPEESVSFAGVDLFHSPTALETLLLSDPDPGELHGFLVFLKLGIAITGIHDGDTSQLAVTVFPKGRWDEFLSKMRVWKHNTEL